MKMKPEEYVSFSAEIHVRDFKKSLEFYKKLGFEVFRIETGEFASLKFGDALFMLRKSESQIFKKHDDFFFRFLVENIDGFYEKIKSEGFKITKPLEKMHYGPKRFYVEDPDGFQLKFISK